MRYTGRCPRCGGDLSGTWLRCGDGSIEKIRWCGRCDGECDALDLVWLPTYRQTLRVAASSFEETAVQYESSAGPLGIFFHRFERCR
jgi:hypothetical protein